MRHGLTLGEVARWYVTHKRLKVDLQVVAMEGYQPDAAPGYGWPVFELPWVNPSPNASSLNMARCFPGTVLFEGTTLSEGRGTTTSLELVGAPDLDFSRVLRKAQRFAPGLAGRLCAATLLFRANIPKAPGQTLRRRAGPHRFRRLPA